MLNPCKLTTCNNLLDFDVIQIHGGGKGVALTGPSHAQLPHRGGQPKAGYSLWYCFLTAVHSYLQHKNFKYLNH